MYNFQKIFDRFVPLISICHFKKSQQIYVDFSKFLTGMKRYSSIDRPEFYSTKV